MLNRFELTGRAQTHVLEFEPGCVLHPLAGESLLAMRDAASAAGFGLRVVSGFRDFKRQLAIWTAKFNGERALLDASGQQIRRADLDEAGLIDSILIWSALPGASRHHWGSEIDIIDSAALPEGARPRLLAADFGPGGPFGRLHDWLDSNMGAFGFFRPYATDRGGVRPEPWHLSHAAVAVPALRSLRLEVLREALHAADMPGRELVLKRLPELYERYVLAVDAA
jgi:LAS superfamily LD-carboxypeptidase LdcB